jgi:multimeric flavodoxin WrbA
MDRVSASDALRASQKAVNFVRIPKDAACQRGDEEADLLIFSTPNYVYDMTGQMKKFFDHFAYFWMPHRPEKSMFGKTALIVTSAAGAGTGKVIKSVKHNLFYWGIAKIYGFGFNSAAMNWEGVAPEKKAKLEKQVSAMALKIKKSIGKKPPEHKNKADF